MSNEGLVRVLRTLVGGLENGKIKICEFYSGIEEGDKPGEDFQIIHLNLSVAKNHEEDKIMEIKQIVKKIEKHRDRVGKERDEIRDLVDEATMLLESCNEAYEDLNRVIEKLSEYA